MCQMGGTYLPQGHSRERAHWLLCHSHTRAHCLIVIPAQVGIVRPCGRTNSEVVQTLSHFFRDVFE